MHAWQLDPWRWTDEAEVLRCEPDGDRWRVNTTPTVLFPEGGGQPADHGAIGEARVVDVRKIDGVVAHFTDRPVGLGAARIVVDGVRRFDHMQQHTGQHLLTATLLARFGVGTTSFHLGADHTAIELDVPSLPAEVLAEAQRLVNEAIREARPVRSDEVAPDELAARGVRSRGLPEGFDGAVRLIEIDGIDLNTCGGTHVSNLAQLQVIRLARVEGVGARGCRLYFLCGGRVLRALAVAAEREARLTGLLSAGPADHGELVERALADRRRLQAQVAALEEARGDAVVARLSATAGRVLEAKLPDAPAKVLQVTAARLAALRPEVVVLLSAPEAGGHEGPVVIAGPEPELAAWLPWLTAELGARGGGRGRWQGRATRLERWASVVDAVTRGRVDDA
jgi:misacylated tRNA(Ala) deacylase